MRRTLSIGLILLGIVPIVVRAETNVARQRLDVTIAQSGIGTAMWTLPINFRASDFMPDLPVPKEFGNTGGTSYSFVSVLDDGKRPVAVVPTSEQSYGFPTDYRGTSGYRTFYLNETISPQFNGPVALYELWTLDRSVAGTPLTTIQYPAGWKVLDVWPTSASSTSGKIIFDDPIEYSPYHPMLVVFQTDRSGVVEQVGKYTISGSAADVAKIRSALALIPDIDTLMNDTLSLVPPEHVYIISDDLTKVDSVGYEADALAANPNIIVFNDRFAKNKTEAEVAEILAHELAHLAMNSQRLFIDQPYYIPWLQEGIAVYFGTVAHKKIYSDPTARVLAEELSHTHAVSPLGATSLYESKFDFDFDGSRSMGTAASYEHAGLLFARLGDVSGGAGFGKLFASLKAMKQSFYSYDTNKQILVVMQRITGLTESQLLYPGQSENDIKGIVGRISHPDNTSDADIDTVVRYIQDQIPHHFVGSSAPVAPAATSPAVAATATTTASTAATLITSPMALGSKGAQVRTLQDFLVSKAFLKKGDSKDSVFDKPLQKALIAYQKSAKISATGTCGPLTRTAINKALTGGK
jgi:hypothetical protein